MIVFIFILGLTVGSFLNVLIDRLPKNLSIVKGRSFCDHCHHKLSWLDLIPVLSFFILGRRCRYCGRKISWQYPLVELATGFIFSFIYLSGIPEWPYIIAIFSGLLVIFLTDVKYRIIPDQVLILMILITLSYVFIYDFPSLINRLISSLAIFMMFLFLVIITRGKGMGLGDVKFSFFMGLFLGFPGVLVAFYLAFLTGAAVSLILILLGKKTIKSKIAFGPFLVYATATSFYFGDQIWNLGRRFLGI